MHITDQQARYLSERMDEVSRSFALVVRLLEEPLRYRMATAYLLCRVVDNIEDCLQQADFQRSRFAEFQRLLTHPNEASAVLSHWETLPWPGLTSDEVRMMSVQGGLPLWQIYTNLGEGERSAVAQWVSTMAIGMENLREPSLQPRMATHRGVECLESEPDYNQYCYFVAGTVGHMVTELVAQHYGFSLELTNDLSELSEACGRGLQKTNIVKGFKDDLGRGISYLPGTWLEEVGFSPLHLQGAPSSWSERVIADLVSDLRSATEYVVALPPHAAGYRMASLLCLLPAYETVALAARKQSSLFTSKHEVKISRVVMGKCQLDARAMVSDNDSILAYARRMERDILGMFTGL